MTSEESKRKLTAILSADVKGYSRLMSEDEEGTVRTLKQHRVTISGLVSAHRGRVVDSPGDNILAEFGSVVDAVKCAVKIQETLKGKNADQPENRRMDFRIGVNLGDVIEEEDRIYGDGVNIAARLEGLAEAGGICISGTAFDQVKNKLSVGYQYLGKQPVKNIPDPVRAYKVLVEPGAAGKVIGEHEPKQRRWGWKSIATIAVLFLVASGLVWNAYWRAPKIEPASKEKMAFPLPDRPSIAVLPFVNLGGDPKEDYFSEGLTEQIITTLSSYPRLFVIARQSVFSYKGKPVKVQQVAEELGVQYVLEGSVQKSGDKLRITAQLIDALTGRHVWSERYDRELKDIFALQDEITINVMNGMSAELTEGEQARRWTIKGVTNLKALEKHFQAQASFCRHTKEDYDVARPLFEEAIALDPKFVWPYVYLGYLHNNTASRGWSESPGKSLQTAFELAQKALAIDDSHDGAHSLLALIYSTKRQYDEALSEAERAVALNSNASDGYMILGMVLGNIGRWEESVLYAKKSIRLSPFPGAAPFYVLGRAYFMTGQYNESIATFNRALKVSPNFRDGHVYLVACYSSLGRDAEATAASKQVLGIDPKFTIESYAKRFLFKNEADGERLSAALRKAGLPDKPPLPLPDKPSIAVLPFVNMSDDKSHEYFSDGLTEEIITALSKTPKLFVIARNSTFVYKGKPVNVQQVSRELGVKYVLEGSVRRSGDKLRTTAQLIDATTGNHLWSERYERSMGEIFAVQDEITLSIVRAMRVTLTSGEQARVIGKGTKNLEAYLKAIEANEQFSLMNRQGSLKAKEFAREAISLDPKYAFPYAILANAHMLDAWFLFAESYEESMKLADDAAHKALSLDENDPFIQSALTNLYVMQRKQEKAIGSAERALANGPAASRSQSSMGIALYFSCRFNEAIPFFEEAIRMDPYPPSVQFRLLGSAYSAVGRHDEALKAYENALRLNPNDIFTHLSIAALYVELGKDDQARAEVREVLRLHPKFSLDYFAKTLTFKDQSFVNRRLELMRNAGLK